MDSFQSRFNQTELDSGVVPIELKNFSSRICNVLFYISLACVSLVGLGYLVMRLKARQFDRLSLRLLIYTCFAHTCLSIAAVCRSLPGARESPVCQFLMFLYVFSDTFTTFLLTAITVNLQIIFVHGIKPVKRLEYYYVLVSFCFAFILAVAPLLSPTQVYGYNENLRSCYYLRFSSPHPSWWALFTLYLWIMVATFYCIVALFLVLYKMHHEESMINEHLDNRNTHGLRRFVYLFVRPSSIQRPSPSEERGDEEDRQGQKSTDAKYIEMPEGVAGPSLSDTAPRRGTWKKVKQRKKRRKTSYVFKTISRVIWYPIVLIVTRVWGMINFSYTLQTVKINAFFTFMSYIAIPIQGIFLFLFFICDPAFTSTVRQFLCKRKQESNGLPQSDPSEMNRLHDRPRQSPSSNDRDLDLQSAMTTESLRPQLHSASPALSSTQSQSSYYSLPSTQLSPISRQSPEHAHQNTSPSMQANSGENNVA